MLQNDLNKYTIWSRELKRFYIDREHTPIFNRIDQCERYMERYGLSKIHYGILKIGITIEPKDFAEVL